MDSHLWKIHKHIWTPNFSYYFRDSGTWFFPQSFFMNPRHEQPSTLRRGFLWMWSPEHMLQKYLGCRRKMQARGSHSRLWIRIAGCDAQKYPHCKQASPGFCCNLSLRSPPPYGFKARLRISVQAELGNFSLLNSSFSAHFRLLLPSVSSHHDPGLSFSITLDAQDMQRYFYIHSGKILTEKCSWTQLQCVCVCVCV